MNYASKSIRGIIASLFHQGMIIEIDKHGDYSVLLKGLSRPHSVQEISRGLYICANSNAKEILIFDHDRTRHRFIGKGWIQNLAFVPHGFYYIDADWGEIGFVKKEEYAIAMANGPLQETFLLNHTYLRLNEQFRLFDIYPYDQTL